MLRDGLGSEMEMAKDRRRRRGNGSPGRDLVSADSTVDSALFGGLDQLGIFLVS